MKKYNHKSVEKKWSEKWENDGLYKNDMDEAKNPYFNLMMFPYPSAEGLHVGNMYAFTGSDIWGRYRRMKGFDVLEPIGLDGFGIHSENYAIKIGEHIRDVSKRTEKHFYEQLRMTGNQYDWSRTVETYDPKYYKWTQWLFIQMYKEGLAYRKKSKVNWCSSCKTVLSDEQVEGGVCERCKTETVTKDMEQWFWKITDYAEKLLDNIKDLDWSDEVRIGQTNWIGKKEGINITYKIADTDLKVTVFTTRPDTNFGATFLVVAPDSKFVEKNMGKFPEKKKVEAYCKEAMKKTELERISEGRSKTGVFTGLYAINQLNDKKMPIFVTDFVLATVGTGCVVGVPGHDVRDFEFAKSKDIEIIRVVVGSDGDKSAITKKEQVQEEEGKMINSGFLDGMDIHKATEKIMDYIEKQGWGKRITTYKLRDWCVSRQRYWGPPIPMIHCKKCGWQPVPEKDLPVKLPEISNFEDILPDGSGKGPLEKVDSFVNTKCPKCGGDAKRETDVSDPFVDSCWYFLRYPSTEFGDKPFDEKRTKKWLPVDMYIGGKEHTVLHLLYSRFITMALKDMGHIDFEEPFSKFFGHGLLIKEGAKMSKSKGNVINPDEYIEKFGADAVRMYLMFLGDFEQGGDWRDNGMNGMRKFVKRLYLVLGEHIKALQNGDIKEDNGRSNAIHRCIRDVEKDIKRLSYNTAISHLMIFFNDRDWGCKWSNDEEKLVPSKKGKDLFLDKNALEKFLIVLAPFAPFIAEELWEQLGNKYSIHQQAWPEYNEEVLQKGEIEIGVQINGKLRDTIMIQKEASKDEVKEKALESEKVKKYVKGDVKKVIYVEGRIINFVV